MTKDTYSVHLFLTGDRPQTVVHRLCTFLSRLPAAYAWKMVRGVKPLKIADNILLAEAEQMVLALRDAGAQVGVKDKDGATVIVKGSYVAPKTTSVVYYGDPAKLGAEAARRDRLNEVSKNYPVELPYYYRACLKGLDKHLSHGRGETPEERRAQADFVQQTSELREWAGDTLTGMFRIRGVVSNSSQYNTIELTNETDALYTKMRWQDDYAELQPNEIEWVWGSPARLFGDNPPSLAYEIVRKQTVMYEISKHHNVPFRFAEGVELALELDTNPVEVKTKDILFVLAPTEDQRDTFLKYCDDYGVMVHAVSKPFDKTVVDKSLFNAIVSVDYDQMDSFENIWARGFARFKRDTRANSQLVSLNSPLRKA